MRSTEAADVATMAKEVLLDIEAWGAKMDALLARTLVRQKDFRARP